MTKRLGTVAPREQVGAKTGAAYDFQYGEAALACLELLASGTTACVYCEWHDDFVVERQSSPPTYEFHQVKSRSAQEGPWPMSHILGVVGKRPRIGPPPKQLLPIIGPIPRLGKKKGRKPLEPAKKVGIAERMFYHQRNFSNACAAFALVTTHEAGDDAFLELLEAATHAAQLPKSTPSDLPSHIRDLFVELVSAYQLRDSTISADEVWAVLTRLRVVRARGRPGEPEVVVGLMGQRIYDLSEVNLHLTEQRRVAAQLLDRVRAKSHRTIDPTALPSENHVRAAKAIEVDEILSLLALSPSGYRELQRGGYTDVRALSRLHRLCRASGMDSDMIDAACRLRVEWEKWRLEHRDNLSDDLLPILRESALRLFRSLRSGTSNKSFGDLRAAADSAASELAAVRGMPQLDSKTILGLVFAIASEDASGQP